MQDKLKSKYFVYNCIGRLDHTILAKWSGKFNIYGH